jgi:hypothetical protein
MIDLGSADRIFFQRNAGTEHGSAEIAPGSAFEEGIDEVVVLNLVARIASAFGGFVQMVAVSLIADI